MRLLVALVVLGSCYRAARPDPALLARIDQLEARVAEQDRALRAQAQPVEVSVLAARIEELVAKLTAIEDKLAKQPAPPPRRRYPDPSAVYAYPIGTSPSLGLPTAKVTIVMVYEFACQYCAKAWKTVDALRKKYGKDLRVVYKNYVVHPVQAMPAAKAACAASLQGKFRVMADLLWAKAFEPRQYDQGNIDGLVVEAKLDFARYEADSAGACAIEIAADNDVARKFAVNGTPGFFINGRYLSGAKDQATFEALIDEEMRKANAAIKAGTKPEHIYAQEVIGKGLTEVPAP